jgi:hypothetical protein
VANRQQHNQFAVVVVKRDIAAITEPDDTFAKLGRHFLDGSADFRISRQEANAFPNRADCATRGSRVLWRQKPMQARYVL